jgi:hypothetical protein
VARRAEEATDFAGYVGLERIIEPGITERPFGRLTRLVRADQIERYQQATTPSSRGVSQRVSKRVEEPIAWIKTICGDARSAISILNVNQTTCKIEAAVHEPYPNQLLWTPSQPDRTIPCTAR